MEKVEVFVQTEGKKGIDVLSVPAGSRVRDLAEHAHTQGLTKHEVNATEVYLEGEESALSLEVSLAEVGVSEHTTVHIGPKGRRIDVTVNYEHETKPFTFGPGVPLRAVLNQAISPKGFNLSKGQATEYTLLLCSTNDQPSLDIHLGSLVTSPATSVCFDLSLKEAVQG